MKMDDEELRPALVGLGVSMGVRRHVGQSQTEAAHEFAASMLAVIDLVGKDLLREVQRFNTSPSLTMRIARYLA